MPFVCLDTGTVLGDNVVWVSWEHAAKLEELVGRGDDDGVIEFAEEVGIEVDIDGN